ncbi:DUF4136 domain-containing protein [Adhaeribacter pallidiroseus]|uniref:DUF4136 domain-containing protein n=1 Tax=Adhaeribacter pallidiroseus TaxID=2072847 RepID=A0A369QNY0_9BACT|nr:DUF4136 domain-containing protein [Adhaeribacter pallidiroseus]RDC64967.1 hypothetical protein AHMF7616_03589 [Adhaeribacter pallidiroseus]
MKNIFLIFFSLIGLFGCSAARVTNVDAADNFALTNYKTFNFYEITNNGEPVDAQYNNRIAILKNAIQQQLTAKGLTLTSTNPDLLVNLGIVTTEKVQTRQTDFRTDAPKYIGQRRYSWKSQQVEVGRYRQGTASVHLVDPTKDELVWQGAIEGVIPKKDAALEKEVNAGVSKLFSKL